MDKITFKHIFDKLAGYFKIQASLEIMAVWYETIAPQMNQQQFQDAVKKAIAVLPPNQPISPLQLIELYYGDAETRALQEWHSDRYSAIGLRAISAIGGIANKHYAEKEHNLYSNFLKMYRRFNADAIASGQFILYDGYNNKLLPSATPDPSIIQKLLTEMQSLRPQLSQQDCQPFVSHNSQQGLTR